VIFDINDLSIGATLEFMISLYDHMTPLRIGLVPVADSDDAIGCLLVNAFYRFMEEKGGPAGLAELHQVLPTVSLNCIRYYQRSL